MAGGQRLPFDGQHPMALEVAERPVVGQHVEAVVDAFERPAGAVATVLPVSAVGPDHGDTLGCRHGSHPGLDGAFRQRRVGVEHRRDHLGLAVRVEVHQLDRVVGDRPSHRVAEDTARDVLHGAPIVGQVARGEPAAVGQVHPLEERGDHLAQFGEHHVGVETGLRKGMGPHPQEQRLVGLACAVDTDIAQRRGREQPADRVQGPGLDRLPIGEVGVAGFLGHVGPEEVLHDRHELRIGREHAVDVAHVARAQRRVQHLRVAVVAVTASQTLVVGDVAGALLQVSHQPAPLQHLGQQVGGLLAGQVYATELGHRIVAVLEEDPVVQSLGPSQADGGVDRDVSGDVEIVDELIEEQPAEARHRPGVAGEQGTLDDLGQVHQREHRLIQVGEVPAQDVGFFGREGLRRVQVHGARH